MCRWNRGEVCNGKRLKENPRSGLNEGSDVAIKVRSLLSGITSAQGVGKSATKA